MHHRVMSVPTYEAGVSLASRYASYLHFTVGNQRLREERSGLTCRPEAEPGRVGCSVGCRARACSQQHQSDAGLPQGLSHPGSRAWPPPRPTFAVLLRSPPAVEGSAAPRGEAQGLAIGLRALLGHELQLGLLTGLDGGGGGQAHEGPGLGAPGGNPRPQETARAPAARG